MLRFDEPALRERLGALAPEARAAFAAACAQRLAGTPGLDAAAALLDAGWEHLLSAPLTEGELSALAGEAERLAPDGDEAEDWRPELAVAENAFASVAYALRVMAGGDARDAVWAARQGIEALDVLAAARLGPGVYDEASERALAEDPLVQAELGRQERDLSDLERARDVREAAARLRERARRDATA